MNKQEENIEKRLVENIQKAMVKLNFYQARLAMEADISEASLNKILNGRQRLSLEYLSRIARALSLREIDLFTWPDRYVPQVCNEAGPAEVLLQLRLTKEKKDQVLKLVFGENNIEILNK